MWWQIWQDLNPQYPRSSAFIGAVTTIHPPVPQGMFEECKLTFLTDTNRATVQHNILPKLALNADQTPCLYISVGRITMASQDCSAVLIKGLTNKRNITLTFVISLSGSVLPMQIRYQGKTIIDKVTSHQCMRHCLSGMCSKDRDWQGFVEVGIAEYWGHVTSWKHDTFLPSSGSYCR